MIYRDNHCKFFDVLASLIIVSSKLVHLAIVLSHCIHEVYKNANKILTRNSFMKRFILATESSCSVSASPVHSVKLIWFTTWPARGRRRTFVADFSVKEKRENKSSLQSTCVSLG